MIGYSRIGIFLAVAGLSATAGAALWERHRPAPPETLVMLSACGLVPAPAPVSLPLAGFFADGDPGLEAGLSAGLALGPIRHPGLDAPLWVRFEAGATPEDAAEDPVGAPELRPHMEEAVLVVPLARDRIPEAIRLGCRHGQVAEVRHRHGGRWHHLPVIPDPQAAGARPGLRIGTVAGGDAGLSRAGVRERDAAPLPEDYTATLAGD